MSEKPEIGSITWRDLTVPDAKEVRDFYADVVGWKFAEHNMGEYADYNVLTRDKGECVGGICHKRGPNEKIPSQWMIYITVDNVEARAKTCEEKGGKILDGPKTMGNATLCVIQDPAGAVCALYDPGEPTLE
jgi:predicted enzyme related to lactoylglutathione lyase